MGGPEIEIGVFLRHQHFAIEELFQLLCRNAEFRPLAFANQKPFEASSPKPARDQSAAVFVGMNPKSRLMRPRFN